MWSRQDVLTSRSVASLVGCLSVWASVGLLAGCTGELHVRGGGETDAGAQPQADAMTSPFDAHVPPGTDAGPSAGADASSPDASSVDAGPAPTPDAHVPTPCETIRCGTNQRCDDTLAACVCLTGFVEDGAGGCRAADPSEPSTRTTADMCAIWSEAHRTTATRQWNEGSSMCDGGTMTAEATADTIRRIIGFRALVGLGPVVEIVDQRAQQQACAVLMYRNHSLNHSPPSSWTCYTSAGAAGAGSSNLALGTSTSADTIDLYVDDGGVDSLGHRRWVLNGALGRVGIGFAGNAGCLSVFDSSGSTARSWIAWPPPGPAPIAATRAWWSFQLMTRSGTASANVTMIRVRDGMDVTGTIHRPAEGYGGATIAWAPTDRAVGERYRVTVTGTPLGEISYEVEIVNCP